MARRRQLEKYFAYKQELAFVASKLGFQMPMGHFAVCFYIPHPRTWRKWKINAYVGTPHRSKPDADNLLKGLFDALIPKKKRSKGETGKDDKELWCYSVFKFWCLPDDGRIEIWEYTEEDYLAAFGFKKKNPLVETEGDQ
jgi:Holliday junction resolvase RusA-like endonuclease